MKNKLETDNIRFLLHRYYEAETNPEEERILEYFFHDTPSEEIPEDMSEDAYLFAAMSELHLSSDEKEVPDGLFEKISQIAGISEVVGSNKTKRNWATRIGYAIAVACACILIALGIRWLTAPKNLYTKPLEYAEESPEELNDRPTALPIYVESKPDSSEQQHLSKTPRPRRRYVMAEKVDDYNELEDGFMEITDPEEVERIALEIGKLISKNNEKANDAIVQLGHTMEDYKQLTKSIMQ